MLSDRLYYGGVYRWGVRYIKVLSCYLLNGDMCTAKLLLFISSFDNLTPYPNLPLFEGARKGHVIDSALSKSSTWTGAPCCTFDAGAEGGSSNRGRSSIAITITRRNALRVARETDYSDSHERKRKIDSPTDLRILSHFTSSTSDRRSYKVTRDLLSMACALPHT